MRWLKRLSNKGGGNLPGDKTLRKEYGVKEIV